MPPAPLEEEPLGELEPPVETPLEMQAESASASGAPSARRQFTRRSPVRSPPQAYGSLPTSPEGTTRLCAATAGTAEAANEEAAAAAAESGGAGAAGAAEGQATAKAKSPTRRALATGSQPLGFQMPPLTQPQMNVRFLTAERKCLELEEKNSVMTSQIAALVELTQAANLQIEALTFDFQRVVGLERMVHEIHAPGLDEFERRVRSLEEAEGFGGRAPKEKLAMINRRGLSDVPSLTGENAGYHDWVFKLKAFCRSESGFEQFILLLKGIG